jgi:DNA-binding CsgD family transcriptional regulator
MLDRVERVSVSPVFVARSAELAELTTALERAEAGQPQALLVAGDAGVGKTRLLEEFTCEAVRRGAAVALGVCVEVGADGLPYAPIVTAMRALHRALPAEVEQAAADSAGHLAQLLPELGRSAAPTWDEDARARLFGHTARLFERLAADRTVVLVLEDLHWSDRSTRELLAYLLRSLRRARVVIVGSYRTDDLHRRHPLRGWLAELERLRTVQRLELPHLARSEVAEQLNGILDTPPEPDLLDRIFRRSEGVPFFVEELAASYQQGCAAGLTESLRDLLLVRVAALPEPVQTVLRVLALGGSVVEYGLLEAVLEVSGDELVALLRSAVDVNILRPSSERDGYRFRHALVREAVADDLLPGEGSRIQRRYATVLSECPQLVPADERASRLAHYWYSAGDPARALPAALDAGREAGYRSAFAEQLHLLERVLELWDRVPVDVLEQLAPVHAVDSYPVRGRRDRDGSAGTGGLSCVDVLAEAAMAARLSGDRGRGFALCRQALRQVDEEADPGPAAWFLTLSSRLAPSRDATRELLQHAYRLIEHGPPSAVQAEVLARLAACEPVDRPTEADVEIAERGVRIARQVGAETVELHARCTLGSLLVILDREQEGLAELDAVLARAGQLQDPDLLSRVHVLLSDVYEGLGRSADAVAVARAGARLRRTNGLLGVSGATLRGNLVESLLSLGQLTEAAALLDAAPPELGSSGDRSFLARVRGNVALLRDDLPEVARQIDLSLRSLVSDSIQLQVPLAELTIRLAAAEGRFGDARVQLLRQLDAPPPTGTPRYLWPLLLHGVAAEADARGLPTAAAGRPDVLARVRETAAGLRRSGPLAQGWSLLLDAELARAEGVLDPAAYLAAVEALGAVGRPYPLDLALLRAAEATAAHGDRTAATALLRRAEQQAARHGDARLLHEAALLAERARLRPADTAAPDPTSVNGASANGVAGNGASGQASAAFGLTPRELAVLHLVALGRSNRQIAQELYISPKTASVHVSNILAKLDVAGRGEAAAMAYRLHLVPA